MPTPFGEITRNEVALQGDMQRADEYTYELLTRRYPVHTIALHAGPFPQQAWVLFLDPARHCQYANTRDRQGHQRCTQHHQSYSWSYGCGIAACYQFHDRPTADILAAWFTLVKHFKTLSLAFQPRELMLGAMMTFDI